MDYKYTLGQIIHIPVMIFDNGTIKEVIKKIEVLINKKLKNNEISSKDVIENNIIVEIDEDNDDVNVDFISTKSTKYHDTNTDDIFERWENIKKLLKDTNIKKTIGPEDDMSKYTFYLKDEIGSGNYGTVFKGINNLTKEEVAIKIIKSKDGAELSHYKEEINCLKKIFTSF